MLRRSKKQRRSLKIRNKIDKALHHAREQAWLGLKAFEEGAAMPKIIEGESEEPASSSKDVEISGIEEKHVLTAETAVISKKKISSGKA